MPQVSAASVRVRPSSTRAIASMRRAASASLARVAACRNPSASNSVRVIATAKPASCESGQGLANHNRDEMGIDGVTGRCRWYEAKPGRERLTLVRIFEALSGLGYEGGYDAV